MTRMFYRGAHGVLLCFDLSNPTTFEDAKNYWLENILSTVPLSLIVLVGMKSDKPDTIEKEQIATEAKRWSVFSRISYFETSSVKYQGMDDPIHHLIKYHKEHLEKADVVEWEGNHSLDKNYSETSTCC
jgi:GTPase SAR1 family protein